MPISGYLKSLRERVGHDLILNPAVAALIRNDAGGILVHQRSDNHAWEIPAGAIDTDEAPAQAVVREVLEETGLWVRPVEVVGVFGGHTVTHPNGDMTQPYCTLFECEVVGGRLEARDGEALAFRYDDPASLPKHALFPSRVFAADFSGVYFDWDEPWLEALS